MLCDGLEGWGLASSGREAQEGGDMCVHLADSCCTAETEHNIVKQLYFNNKAKGKGLQNSMERTCDSSPTISFRKAVSQIYPRMVCPESLLTCQHCYLYI